MKPYMIISKDAYEKFNKDEMQWLLFHESGHYILWHSGKMILLHLFFLFVGFIILSSISSKILLTFLLGILFAIIYIQIVRRFEYEANYFALSKMDNPKGLSTLYAKAKVRYWKRNMNKNRLWLKLFNVWNLDIYRDLMEKAALG